MDTTPAKDHYISWQNKITGVRGRGRLMMTEDDANRISTEMNAEYPNFNHFATKCPPSSPEQSKPAL